MMTTGQPEPPLGAAMKHLPKSKYDGATPMTPDQAQGKIRERIIQLITSGEATQKEVGQRFGLSQQRVSQIISEDKLRRKKAYGRSRLDPDRKRVIKLAAEATSIKDLSRISGRGNSFVCTTLTLFAPEEFYRLRGGVKPPEPDPEPQPRAVNWTARAQAFLPGDDALARSMSRLASFVGRTREGSEVRIVPPGTRRLA